MKVHKFEDSELDRDFIGEVLAEVTYHAPCHLRAQNIGLKSRDLVKLTGAKVKVVAECSGIDGTWGYRQDNYAASRQVAKKMGNAIDKAGGDVVIGDCHLANGGIVQETGRTPQHPLMTIARPTASPKTDPSPEMARAEKLISDEAIETELRIYNPLIPEPVEPRAGSIPRSAPARGDVGEPPRSR
jgi:hypothetical protein